MQTAALSTEAPEVREWKRKKRRKRVPKWWAWPIVWAYGFWLRIGEGDKEMICFLLLSAIMVISVGWLLAVAG